jgi:hypothetical protein
MLKQKRFFTEPIVLQQVKVETSRFAFLRQKTEWLPFTILIGLTAARPLQSQCATKPHPNPWSTQADEFAGGAALTISASVSQLPV